jgi:hypothetical protein
MRATAGTPSSRTARRHLYQFALGANTWNLSTIEAVELLETPKEGPCIPVGGRAWMNEQQAIEAARQIGVEPGDHITLQSEGQIMNPHLHKAQRSGEMHVDGWLIENDNGELKATKLHSDR